MHRIEGTFEVLSLSSCEQNFDLFYKQNIQELQYVGASFTCGECHSRGGDYGPQFLDGFSQFVGMSDGKGSLQEKVEASTALIIRNATVGFNASGWDHQGGDFFAGDPISAESIQSALEKASENFYACDGLENE